MISYDERLAQRREEATAMESAYVRHFGPEAEKYDNWARLWRTGWQEELVNPAPTLTYQPKGLPRDEEGNILSGGTGADGSPLPPSLSHYSPKFLFALAQATAHGGPQLVAAISNILAEADEVDCDQLTEALDKLTTYLSNYALRSIDGTGYVIRVGQLDRAQIEQFFRSWNENTPGSGVFITHFGIAIPGRPVVPFEAATNVIEAALRQVVVRRKQYVAQTQTPSGLARHQSDKKFLGLASLALILIYENKWLQRGEEANALAAQEGHSSGDKLYIEYCRYSAKDNRTGFDNETATKAKHMIKRIQAALPKLSSSARVNAENEIELIRARIA